jgi:hypothetical protein
MTKFKGVRVTKHNWTVMLQQKSTKELIGILENLQSSLEKLNPEKKQLLFNQDDSLILNSNAPEIEKKKWVISKMVLFRTAIFSEFSDRIEISVKEKNLNKAVDYMNDYIFSFALPFIDNLKPPSRLDKLSAQLSKKSVLTPYEYLEKWKTDYSNFKKVKTSDSTMNDYLKSEKYRELVSTYNMLYNLSFSWDNNPASQAFVVVDRNRVKTD